MDSIDPDGGAATANPAPLTANATVNAPAMTTANTRRLKLFMDTPCGHGPSAQANTDTNQRRISIGTNGSGLVFFPTHSSTAGFQQQTSGSALTEWA